VKRYYKGYRYYCCQATKNQAAKNELIVMPYSKNNIFKTNIEIEKYNNVFFFLKKLSIKHNNK
tara:strand:+ start:1014 stop:1202 length:189 start_codon:yes stop_codon:yes gene_type:complete